MAISVKIKSTRDPRAKYSFLVRERLSFTPETDANLNQIAREVAKYLARKLAAQDHSDLNTKE